MAVRVANALPVVLVARHFFRRNMRVSAVQQARQHERLRPQQKMTPIQLCIHGCKTPTNRPELQAHIVLPGSSP